MLYLESCRAGNGSSNGTEHGERMTKYRGSATVCVVCADKVGHHSGETVVGRKPNGVPRLLCGKRQCRKVWNDPTQRAAIVAKWVENREA